MELRPRVLVMTSSGETRQRLAALLAGAEYRVEPCEVGADTGRCLRSDLSLVLVDLSLTDVDPVDFVRRTATRNASIKQLVLSARGDYERIIAVIRAGAHGCVFRDAPDAELASSMAAGRLRATSEACSSSTFAGRAPPRESAVPSAR